jgi:hypothetical protein
MTLTDLQTAHPYGVYSERFGCYYTLDYDMEMGYFIQLVDGSFETEWNWVDFDTLEESVSDELELLAKNILVNQ